jgi:antitoxin HicB
MDMTDKKHKGSTFDSFLEEEGLFEDAEAIAIKRVIAYELEKTMKKKHFTKTIMATKMQTSRSALDRLLDPTNTSITLITLVKAAHLLGKKLKIVFG